MTIRIRCLVAGLLLAAGVFAPAAHAVELKVERQAIDRTLRQQLFSGQYGRFYIKGSPQTPCYTYAESPQLLFTQGRVAVLLHVVAKVGKSFGSSCLGFTLNLPVQVSVMPDAQGESVGFRDAKLDKISDQRELNFILMPFLSHQVPSSMRVNAGEMLRKSLASSTATSGYKISLDKLEIRAIDVTPDYLVVNGDGTISVQ
jgi:hypothetical protein